MISLVQKSFFFLVAITLCALFGLMVPVLGPKFSLIFLAAFIGSAALFVKTEWLLFILCALSLFVVGPLGYFGIVNLHWIPYIIGLLLYVKFTLEKFNAKSADDGNVTNAIPFSGMNWAIFLFFSILIGSTLIARPNSHVLLLSTRDYFLLWSVFFLLSSAKVTPSFFQNILRLMVFAAVLQLPFALYQHFVVARGRHDTTSWDAVVGSFSGYQDGGGDSGGMAIFLLTVFAVALCLWRRKITNGLRVCLIGAIALGTVLLAEVKIFYVLTPIVFVMVYRTELLHSASVALIGTSLISILFAIVFLTYDSEYDTQQYQSQKALGDKIEDIFSYSTNANAYMSRSEVGRVTALAIWWQGNEISDPAVYIGHGMAATLSRQRIDERGGKIGERYGKLTIANSTFAVLLWEAGIFGALAFCFILILALFQAIAISRKEIVPTINKAILDATPAVLAMYLVTLFYHKNAIGASSSGQLILLFFLGHVAYWARKTHFNP